MEFRVFELQPYADQWLTLLRANGEDSPQCDDDADGELPLMCCLLLPPGVAHSRPLPEHRLFEDEPPTSEELAEAMAHAGEWGAVYRRIAVVVQVYARDGIGMAQHLCRLDITSCSEAGAGRDWGMRLLAHVARCFRLQYLLLSPMHPFREQVQRALDKREIPHGILGYGSLRRALRDTTTEAHHYYAVTVEHAQQLHDEEQEWYDAVELRIEPSRFSPTTNTFAQPRVLHLDPRTLETAEYRRQNGRMRVHEGLDTSCNFLWELQGDGAIAIDGPCLAFAYETGESPSRLR